MNERDRLPNRREHEALDFWHGSHRYTAGVGRYPDGRPAEVFLDTRKSGELLQALARDAATIVSIALQHGAPIDTIRAAVTREQDGTAAGPMGALLDLLAEAA